MRRRLRRQEEALQVQELVGQRLGEEGLRVPALRIPGEALDGQLVREGPPSRQKRAEVHTDGADGVEALNYGYQAKAMRNL